MNLEGLTEEQRNGMEAFAWRHFDKGAAELAGSEVVAAIERMQRQTIRMWADIDRMEAATAEAQVCGCRIVAPPLPWAPDEPDIGRAQVVHACGWGI